VSGNLTRINNNQITDAVSGNTQFGINANTKVQPHSITSSLLANNLTYGSDLTITGNLSITGNVTAIDTTNTTIEDPLLLLASQQTGSPTVDIGFIGQRGTSNNVASVWDESLQSFVTVYTSSGAGDHTNIAILSYADFITGNANVTGNLIAGNVSLNGNVTSPLNVTGNIAAGNIYSTGLISTTGNIATANYFVGDGYYISNINASNVSSTKISNGTSSANIVAPDGNLTITINGNLNSTFYNNGVSVVGNIETGNSVNAGNLSLSGNVIGNLNVDGNIIPSANAVYSLGNATNVWKDLYLSSNTLYVGPVQVGANATSNVLTVNNDIVVTYSNSNADINASGTISAGGNIVAYDSVSSQSLSLSGNVISTLNITTDVTAQNLYATSTVSSAGNVNAFDTVNSDQLSLSGNVISALNVTLDATAQNLYATTTVSSAGNVNAYDTLNANQLSLSGNVIANLNATFDVNANNVTTVNYVSAGGNVYGANFATTGAQGNITGANIVSAVTFTATGNVYATNVFAQTDISAQGNITTQQTFNGNALSGNSLIISSASGGLLFSVTGNINAGNTYITQVVNPENPQDVATKSYVDGVANGLQVKASSNTATTGNLLSTTGQSYTYNNGTLGVGATITFANVGNVTIDNVQLTSGMRVLIKNEPLANVTNGTTPSAAYNGIYTVTTAGSPSAALVLTRATDDDTPAEMYSAYTFITGSATSYNKNSGWASTNTPTSPGDPIVIGTTFYIFVQFSRAGAYSGGNAIDITGSTISALFDGSTVGVNGSNQLYIPANAPLTTPNIGDATGNSLSVTGSLTGDILTVTTASVTGNAFLGNISTGNISLTGNVLTNLNVTTDVNAGNIVSYGLLSAVGNVYGGNISSANIYDTSIGAGQIIFGNADSTGRLSSLSTLTTDGNNVSVGGNVSAAGNVTAANFATSGSGGNISGANVISATTFTATGNVYGNVAVFANVSATGNVGAGQYLFGDGGYISNINAANVSSTKISNGGSYANIASPDANLVIAIGSSSNVAATFYDTGVNFAGDLSTVGNVKVDGYVSAAGNITSSANIVLTGTGNINGYNGYFSNNLTVIGTFQSTSNITANGAGIFYGNTVTGNSALYAGVPGFTPLGSNVVLQVSGNANSYSQINFQNINTGSGASTDLILTADNGNDTTYYADFGIAGNNHSDSEFFGDSATENDVYLYAVASNQAGPSSTSGPGNLILGSTNGQIKLFVGNTAQANVIQQVSSIGIAITGIVKSTGNIQSGNTFTTSTSENSVQIGNTMLTEGATLAINATDSMLLPVGNTAQRPGTPATGMLRYNSTLSQCEVWNGAAWTAVGGSSYTVITNEQFNGDGSTVAFTLGSSQTTDSCIVTINGVVQIPTTAYSVSGTYPTCVLTFTEAPEVADIIDVREITTTTTVTAISNSTGNSVVSIQETIGEVDITGNLVAQLNPAAPSLTANSTMSFQLVNNTTLSILVRGTDGVTRHANITLA
jgi:cytoskeletal protein CcmA (bactofilin family)